jgi:hypothetical protein
MSQRSDQTQRLECEGVRVVGVEFVSAICGMEQGMLSPTIPCAPAGVLGVTDEAETMSLAPSSGPLRA